MQSLKDLRAQNAARKLSQKADDIASEITPSNEFAGAATPFVSGTTAASVPRVGKTLAPLSSAGSLQPITSRDEARDNNVTSDPDDTQQEDRETRRRRRRRRRERERGDDDDRLNNNEAVLSVASPASTVEGTGGTITGTHRRMAKRAYAEEKNKEEGDRKPPTEDVVDESVAGDVPPLSARGAPPQEKPQKKLSPLAARRARIEQQKREQAERKTGGSRESLPVNPLPLPSDSEGRGAGPETQLERRDDSGGQETEDRSSREGAVETQREAGSFNSPSIKGSGVPGNTNPRDVEEGGMPGTSEERNTEHDPLIPGVLGKSNAGDDGGNQTESVKGESGIRTKGDDAEAAGASERDEAVEGRFKGMRGRMKKAGQDLINKSPGFRRAKAEETALEDNSRSEGNDGEARRRSFGEPLPGNGGEDGAGETGTYTATNRASRGDLAEDQDDSNTSDDSVLSPTPSEAENDDINDGDAAPGKGGRDRKKNWRRKKGLAEAALGADKEVTLGHVVDRKMREMGYIRKPAVGELKNRRSWRDRVAAEGAPEVHFIGEISGAEGFGPGVSCRFRVEGGRHWTCLAGLEEGQTHVIHTDYGESFAPWNHPIDLHYTTKSIQGWPRLLVQVWQLDMHGRNVLRGYGFRHLPSTPGFSEVSVPCWRPTGTMQEETAAFFLEVTPRLTTEDAVFNRAWDQRCRLVTLPAGTVWIQMTGLFRNFQDQSVDSLLFN